MKFALCIVGCGQFARTFVQGLQPLRNDIDLYFASRDMERAQAYAAMFQGCGAFGSYEAAAADPRVEAMYLCTPHHLHQVHVAMAARAGKHILVEKPIARTLEEGRAIIAAAQRAGVTLMVAENYRFMAVVRQCKALIERGSVGGLRLVQLQEEAPFQPVQWRSSQDLNGGGVFIDGGIHKVHLLRYLAGEPEHLYAASLPQALDQHEGEDGVVVMTRGAGGVVGVIHHAWTSSQRLAPPWVAVSGTKGRIYFEVGASWLRIEQGSIERTVQCAEDASGLTPMVRAFRDSVREGQAPEMSGAEGLNDLAVVLKAYEAMEQGVSLPLTRPSMGAGGTG
jgi:UDP-N-acetyl-2-amino-2-deoxyglucuronate dehydrogenase